MRILPRRARKRSGCRQFAVEPPRNSHEFRYEIEISATESRARCASHLITRSPRSRIRENSASPSAGKRSGCRQFAVEPPRNSHEFRYEIEISATESRARRAPATLSLVPLVAEFVRILPRRAQESGADADNSQSNYRGILTNSATRLRFLLRRAGPERRRQPPYHSFPS